MHQQRQKEEKKGNNKGRGVGRPPLTLGHAVCVFDDRLVGAAMYHASFLGTILLAHVGQNSVLFIGDSASLSDHFCFVVCKPVGHLMRWMNSC